MKNKVLVLAPHPDDGEFGCGGTLKRFSEEGREIWYAAFAPCDKSLPEAFVAGTLYEELREATAHLGIAADHVITYDFEVREFPRDRQLILEALVELGRKVQPDLVLLPNAHDVHQDHHVIYEEGVRAFKRVSILGYELPWNNTTSDLRCLIALEQQHVDAKNKALQAYKSQSFRGYRDTSFILSLAQVRGVQAGTALAEAFETVRWYL